MEFHMINMMHAYAHTNRKEDIFMQRRLYIDNAHAALNIFCTYLVSLGDALTTAAVRPFLFNTVCLKDVQWYLFLFFFTLKKWSSQKTKIARFNSTKETNIAPHCTYNLNTYTLKNVMIYLSKKYHVMWNKLHKFPINMKHKKMLEIWCL